MSMFVPTLLSPLSRPLSTSNTPRAVPIGTPPRIRIAVPWLLGILLLAPQVFAAGSVLDGPRVASAPCGAGSMLVPSASFSSTAIQGPTILDLEDSGMLEIEISTVAPETGVGNLTLRPCASTAVNDDLGVDLPGLVLSAGPTERTAWIHRPGHWIVRWDSQGEGSSRPVLLRTRFTPWREQGEIDLFGHSLNATVDSDFEEVALLSRWAPTAPELFLDKEEDHEVDPDPSTSDPSGGPQGRGDLYWLELGRRQALGPAESLGWVLFFAQDSSGTVGHVTLTTKEEDHEVDPDPSVTGVSTTETAALWNAWVVPAGDGEALWVQWRETSKSNTSGSNATDSRLVSRAIELTHWLDPVADSETTLSFVPTRVLPWHLAASGAGVR